MTLLLRPDPADALLLDRFQHGFPLTPRPFGDVAAAVGLGETDTIARFRGMQERGLITRIGAVVAPNAIGASTLAAMRVPPERLDQVAALVSAEPCVTHNYERDNAVNLWFVVAAPTADELEATLSRIAEGTGLPVENLRLERAFHLDLGFPLAGPRSAPHRQRLGEPDLDRIADGDADILAAIEDGLALVPRPYQAVGKETGLTEETVIERLKALRDAHVIRRFGVVVRHRALGIGANAMAVWAVDPASVDAVGERLAQEPGVNLCYRRHMTAEWPFNLYCMVHGRSREDAFGVIERLDAIAAEARDRAVLFSRRCFKQTGARFSSVRSAA
jgi:DNA-binding Lrp family transcriptional regulator